MADVNIKADTSRPQQSLTLAMLTYQRSELVTKRIKEYCELQMPANIQILVVAEEKADPVSWERLLRLKEDHEFTLRSSNGVGYAGAFLRSISESTAKFSMHVSDEDRISPAHLSCLANHLEEVNSDAVVINYDAISGSEKKYAVRSNRSRDISPNEIWKCSHNPGVIFRTEYAQNAAKNLVNDADEFPVLFKYYPHLLMLINPICARKAIFNGDYSLLQHDESEKLHGLIYNQKFNEPGLRWMQHREMLSALEMEIKRAQEDPKLQRGLESMRASLHIGLFSLLRSSLCEQRGVDMSAFDLGVMRYFIKRFLLVNKIQALYDAFMRGSGAEKKANQSCSN